MTITLKRQLTDAEKRDIVKVHGRKCWAPGHTIPETDVMQFDHIRAFGEGGVTELSNIAPMCETHNKAKGILALEDFRVKLRLGDFLSHGDAVTLKHLLAYMRKSGDVETYGQTVVVDTIVNGMESTATLESGSTSYTSALYTCPTTRWKSFYATLPVALLDSDDDEDQKIGLQPRFLISDKVFELYRHFQRHPVLQPSIGRLGPKPYSSF